MVGILVVTHNTLGESLLDCVRHVLGDVPANVRALSVFANDSPDQKLVEAQALVKQLDNGSGVLVLTDVFGATPSNVARQLCHTEHVMGVAGVNLPMLLRTICHPDMAMPDLAHIAYEGGRECIVHMETEENQCLCKK